MIRQGGDDVGVPCHRAVFAAAHVPQFDFARLVEFAAGGGDFLAVGAIGDRKSAAPVGAEAEARLAAVLEKIPFPIAQIALFIVGLPVLVEDAQGPVEIGAAHRLLRLPHLGEVKQVPHRLEPIGGDFVGLDASLFLGDVGLVGALLFPCRFSYQEKLKNAANITRMNEVTPVEVLLRFAPLDAERPNRLIAGKPRSARLAGSGADRRRAIRR